MISPFRGGRPVPAVLVGGQRDGQAFTANQDRVEFPELDTIPAYWTPDHPAFDPQPEVSFSQVVYEWDGTYDRDRRARFVRRR